jgi:hypothetical protein
MKATPNAYDTTNKNERTDSIRNGAFDVAILRPTIPTDVRVARAPRTIPNTALLHWGSIPPLPHVLSKKFEDAPMTTRDVAS